MASHPSALPEPGEPEWPGRRLGLPQYGPRSVGRPGRRLIALTIDWAIAYAVAWWFFPTESGPDPVALTVILVVAQTVFVAVAAGSIGHLVVGLRVVPLRGGAIGAWRPALRAVLLVLVIPAVIWDSDQRGLHDKAAGTILVRATPGAARRQIDARR